MAEARQKAVDVLAWNHTAAVLAQIYNVNRPQGARAIDPMQFYPWDKTSSGSNRAPPPTAEERALLRKAFPGGSA